MSFISNLISNITSFRVKVGEKLNLLSSRIGSLPSLSTNNKESLVDAINEVGSKSNIFPQSKQLRTYYFKTPDFVSRRKFRIYIDNSFSGTVVLKITGGWSSSPTNGEIVIQGGVGVNKGSFLWGNNLNCTNSIGDIRTWIYINPNMLYDSEKGLAFFEFYKKYEGLNDYAIELKLLSQGIDLTQVNPYLVDMGDMEHIPNTNHVTYKSEIEAEGGNSTQWNEAWMRGDFRTYGLGVEPTLGINIDTSNLLRSTRFVGITPTTGGTLPFGYGNLINMSYGGGDEWTQIAINQGEDSIVFRTKRYTGVIGSWIDVWTSSNFNPSAKADVTEINNIYDLLSAKASTRLGNIVSDLSPSEQQAIASKLGLTSGNSPYKPMNGSIITDTAGLQTTVTGTRSQALGGQSIIIGDNMHFFGVGLMGGGYLQANLGNYSNTSGVMVNSVGNYNSGKGSEINLFGNYLSSKQSGQSVYGNYNQIDYILLQGEPHKVHVFASGTSEYDRKNAVEIFSDDTTNFKGKAKYDSGARNPDWFGEQNILVDTTVAGMYHGVDMALDCTFDTGQNLIGVCVRKHYSDEMIVFESLSQTTSTLSVFGLVDGLRFSSGGLNLGKVHRSGTVMYNKAQSLELITKFKLQGANNNLYLTYTQSGTGTSYNFDSVRVGTDFAIYTALQNRSLVVVLGQFHIKTIDGKEFAYFEFNRQTLR